MPSKNRYTGNVTKPGHTSANSVRDALVTYAIVLALLFAVAPIGFSVPLLGGFSGIVTVLAFLYAPMIVAKIRGEDIGDYGFNTRRLGRSLVFALVTMAVILPLFVLGHFALRDVVCAEPEWARQLPVMSCRATDWQFPDLATWADKPGREQGFLAFVATQFGVVALTEELFMRGMVLTLLERKWQPRWRPLGGGIGLALVVTSILFGLIHWPQHGPGQAFVTIFPALWFGWVYSATRSIVASVICHAMANIVQQVLYAGFV